MTETLVKYETKAAQIERVVIENDLSKLTPEERLAYYIQTCEALGLTWQTKPFSYLNLNGKLTLYATRDCTDQLREKRHVSISRLERERVDDLYVVTATARMPDGREDSSIGAVTVTNLKGEALANAFMKAETKAKRRVTLSICGLGMTDESEVEMIPGARIVEPDALPTRVDTATGEIIETPAKSKRRKALEDGYTLMCQRYGEQFGIPPLNPEWTDEDLQGTGNHWKGVVQEGLAAAKRVEEAAAAKPVADEDLPF